MCLDSYLKKYFLSKQSFMNNFDYKNKSGNITLFSFNLFFRIISSSRRLSKMKYLHPLTHPLHQCPRLSYIYPFPIMSTYHKYFPYSNAETFLKSIFTCLPLIAKQIKNHEKSSDKSQVIL